LFFQILFFLFTFYFHLLFTDLLSYIFHHSGFDFVIFIWFIFCFIPDFNEIFVAHFFPFFIYHICSLLLVFINANFLFHHKCRIGLYVSCIVLLSLLFMLHTMISIFFHKWNMGEYEKHPDFADNYELFVLEDILTILICVVHFLSLITGVFSIFERHDLKFELNEKPAILRHAFYLTQVLMIIPIILWLIVVIGNKIKFCIKKLC